LYFDNNSYLTASLTDGVAMDSSKPIPLSFYLTTEDALMSSSINLQFFEICFFHRIYGNT